MDPALADVVESFCAVELYLPDYIAKALPLIRANRGWAWFHANWGYEESKHSLALEVSCIATCAIPCISTGGGICPACANCSIN